MSSRDESQPWQRAQADTNVRPDLLVPGVARIPLRQVCCAELGLGQRPGARSKLGSDAGSDGEEEESSQYQAQMK